MNNQASIEQLAAAIAEDIYLDIARWHLYLDDAKVHIELATQLWPLIQQRPIDSTQVQQILAKIPITIGNGKQTLPLVQFIPASAETRLLEIFNDLELKS